MATVCLMSKCEHNGRIQATGNGINVFWPSWKKLSVKTFCVVLRVKGRRGEREAARWNPADWLQNICARMPNEKKNFSSARQLTSDCCCAGRRPGCQWKTAVHAQQAFPRQITTLQEKFPGRVCQCLSRKKKKKNPQLLHSDFWTDRHCLSGYVTTMKCWQSLFPPHLRLQHTTSMSYDVNDCRTSDTRTSTKTPSFQIYISSVLCYREMIKVRLLHLWTSDESLNLWYLQDDAANLNTSCCCGRINLNFWENSVTSSASSNVTVSRW